VVVDAANDYLDAATVMFEHSFSPAMSWVQSSSATRHHPLRRPAIILPPFYAAAIFRLAAATAAPRSGGIWPLPVSAQPAELSAAFEELSPAHQHMNTRQHQILGHE